MEREKRQTQRTLPAGRNERHKNEAANSNQAQWDFVVQPPPAASGRSNRSGQCQREGSTQSNPSLIPYGNEPEGMGVSQAVGDVGIGLSGMQMLS